MTQKPPAVISLFDLTGEMVKPWANAGYQCFIFDMQHSDDRLRLLEMPGDQPINPFKIGGTSDTWAEDIAEVFRFYDVKMVFGFPPCTDLAVSGARHFAAKAAANPNYLADAMELVYLARDIGETYGVPYMIENPVSVISTQWRKPCYRFDPASFGGYLPEDDQSPHPDVIPARDAYTKRTCLWTGNGFAMPEHRPVEPVRYTGKDGLRFNPQTWMLGGKSLRTKNLRSATPRGFATAVYLANQ